MNDHKPDLTPDQLKHIEALAREDARDFIRRRAKIILAFATGSPTRDIAREVGLSRSRVRYWKQRFRLNAMEIFPIDSIKPIEQPIDQREATHALQIPSPTEIAHKASQFELRSLPQRLKKSGIEPCDLMAEAGRKTFYFHFAEMLSHEGGTRLGEDPEELHDMRVATRRMRAAFEIFENYFDGRAIKPYLKGLRAIGRVLGGVRDLDVFIEKAQTYLASQEGEARSGLEPLIAAWQAEREAARAKMFAYLDGNEYKEFIYSFSEFVQSPGTGVRSLSNELPTPHLVKDVVPVLIYTRWSAVRAYEPLLQVATLDQFHALRIEFKKLRYAIEFFREVLGGEAQDLIDSLKKVQDHLGNLNDARVACQTLSDFLGDLEKQQASVPLVKRLNPKPIVAYLAVKHAERHDLMTSFQETWDAFNRQDFRVNLALAVSVL